MSVKLLGIDRVEVTCDQCGNVEVMDEDTYYRNKCEFCGEFTCFDCEEKDPPVYCCDKQREWLES